MGRSRSAGPSPACLWLSADIPSVGASGRVTYSGGLARALAAAGSAVVGLGLEPSPPAAPLGDDGVEWRPVQARRRSAATSVTSPWPKMAHVLAGPAYRSALGAALDERTWDGVVVDHLQMGWVLPAVRRARPDLAIVYASQNHEASVRRQVAEAARGSAVQRSALRLDAWKAARLERRLVAAARLVTAVTEADAERFRANRPGLATLVIPPGYDGNVPAPRRITGDLPRRAVVLGSLDWHVKQANLRSFLQVADPLFAAAGAEIVVAGAAPAGFVASLPELRATTFTGWVDDLGSVLPTARVGIVSEPLGGGFKLKCLDYVFHRVPLAVLAGSADGLPLVPGQDHLEAPTIDRLVADTLAALDDTDRLDLLQRRAFEACRTAFEWADRGEALHAALVSWSAGCRPGALGRA